MLNLILLSVLVAESPSRSLSEATKSLGSPSSEVVGTPIPGSKMLFAVTKPAKDSLTDFLVTKILSLEKTMDGVNEKSESDVKKRDPELRKIVSSVLDLELLGRAALATHWAEISKKPAGQKQLDRYLKLFHELVEENYMEKIRVYVGGKYQITFTGESTGKKGTIAQAKIKKKDADLVVEFIAQKKDGVWHVADTRLDETSLEETYRGSFNRIIKKNRGVQAGFPELMKVMEKRLSELKKGKATKL